MQNSSFEFDSYDIDLPGKQITFRYKIQREEETIPMVERLILPQEVVRDIPEDLLHSIVQQLHIILGISYWKLFCPKKIIVSSTHLNKAQAAFWNTVYTKGLGEFFYRNSIDYRGLISFPYEESANNPVSFHNANRSLVGVGGGKDSLVSIELLKKFKKDFSGFMLLSHESAIINNTIKESGILSLSIRRVMDAKLAELNKRGDSYNGHIPISAIYAFVGVLMGILYDYRYVITSNEQSANYGNVTYLGETINHQWSKSIEFEQMFQTYIHDVVSPDIIYFSLLRPWNEIRIAHVFSQYPQYFSIFSSCNRNFSSKQGNSQGQRWCGECPKCAFVFALLAASIPKGQLLSIFGENLFSKNSLLPIYRELLGIAGIKPFECVGTPEETQVAFHVAHKTRDYEDDTAMKMFIAECMPTIDNIEQLQKSVFRGADIGSVPEEFREVIENNSS